MSKKPSVSIVIPTYNEEKNLTPLVEGISRQIKDYEIIIVDDGSKDGTLKEAKALAKKYPVRVLERGKKLGLGSAYRDGFRLAKGDIVFEMDADGSHDPKQLPFFLEKIRSKADIVVGSRYVKGGGVVNWNWHRKLISWGGNKLAQTFLGLSVPDATSGYRAFNKKAARVLSETSSNGYAFQVETLYLAKQRGLRVEQTPIVFKDREVGESKIGSSEILGFLAMLLSLSRFLKFALVGFSGTLVNLAVLWASVNYLGLWYILGASLAFGCAVTNNFFWNKYWTFENREKKIKKQFGQFLTVSLFGLCINLLLLYALVEYFGLWYMLAQVVAIACVLVFNYAGNSAWTFKQ